MSGDTPFARGLVAENVRRYGEGEGVEEMLRGFYSFDHTDMTHLTASSEMKSFITALKVPTSVVTGEPIPEMASIMTLHQYKDKFNATR